jgi:hypothetical protein
MTQTSKLYRTAKGNHAHADFECANQRRAIESGAPVEVAPGELPPCEHCCDTETVKTAAATAAAKQAAMCVNSGVRKPRHIQSECVDCGKRGTVNRSTGTLRAHKPAA